MNRLSRIRETIPLRPKYAAPLLIFMGHRSRFAAPFPAATRLGVVARCGQEPVRRRQVEDGSRLRERLDVDGPDPKPGVLPPTLARHQRPALGSDRQGLVE